MYRILYSQSHYNQILHCNNIVSILLRNKTETEYRSISTQNAKQFPQTGDDYIVVLIHGYEYDPVSFRLIVNFFSLHTV